MVVNTGSRRTFHVAVRVRTNRTWFCVIKRKIKEIIFTTKMINNETQNDQKLVCYILFMVDSGGQQGRLGQQFSLSRPRTCADEYIKSAVPAVPHQSFNVRLKAEISFVSLWYTSHPRISRPPILGLVERYPAASNAIPARQPNLSNRAEGCFLLMFHNFVFRCKITAFFWDTQTQIR